MHVLKVFQSFLKLYLSVVGYKITDVYTLYDVINYHCYPTLSWNSLISKQQLTNKLFPESSFGQIAVKIFWNSFCTLTPAPSDEVRHIDAVQEQRASSSHRRLASDTPHESSDRIAVVSVGWMIFELVRAPSQNSNCTFRKIRSRSVRSRRKTLRSTWEDKSRRWKRNVVVLQWFIPALTVASCLRTATACHAVDFSYVAGPRLTMSRHSCHSTRSSPRRR